MMKGGPELQEIHQSCSLSKGLVHDQPGTLLSFPCYILGEINWWERRESRKENHKDCGEQKKLHERQLLKKIKSLQRFSSGALWPQVLHCSNEAVLTRSF